MLRGKTMRWNIGCLLACWVFTISAPGCSEKGSNIPTQPRPKEFIPVDPAAPNKSKSKSNEIGLWIDAEGVIAQNS
jgi:hypothetical protein